MPPASSTAARDAETASTRERLLEVALATFSELGYDGASTREIARRADANPGLIPYYFESKERLWREAVSRAFDGLWSELTDALREAGDLGDRARLRVVIHRYVRFVARNSEFIRVMHDEGKREGPRMRWLVDQHVRTLYAATTSAIARAQAQGAGPAGVDPLHLHYILIGAVALVFHQAPECRRLTGREPTDEAFIAAHADAVARLFLGALSQPEEDAA